MGLLDTWDEWKRNYSRYEDRGKDILFGEKQSVLPGQETMRRTETGLVDKSLEYAGGAIDETLFGKQARTHHPTEGTLEGVGYVPQRYDPNFDVEKDKWISQGRVSEGLINKSAKKSIEITKDAIEKGAPWAKEKIEEAWSAIVGDEGNNSAISLEDKKKFIAGYGEGKVDPALAAKLKQKAGPINEQDVGTLEKIIGMDVDTVKAKWKDKGGMEGLMSNPAFSLGLALMQSSANGKTINQGILDNFVKSAKISEHYKDRIKARGSIIGPPSDADIGQVESLLKSRKIGGPGIWGYITDFMAGQTNHQDYQSMLSKIATKNNQRASDLEAKGKKVVKDEAFMAETLKIMKNSGELSMKKKGKKKGFLSNLNIFQTKIQKKKEEDIFKAQGGPVQAGKPYVVGEQGPEIIIPRSDGNVLSNDDSQIYAMLLAANPQLQKVSKSRAESILKSRFPVYFA